jgi:hypothetical protein
VEAHQFVVIDHDRDSNDPQKQRNCGEIADSRRIAISPQFR